MTWPGQQSFSRMLGLWLQPCRHPISDSSDGLLSNTFWEGHESGILITCLSYRYRQDARFAVQLSKLVVHPSPPNSMLQHTAKDGPEDASLKHAQSVCILRSDGAGLVSAEDHRANKCAIYLTFLAGSKSSGSQQSVKPIVCLIPLPNASPDFAADVVGRNNYRSEIAELSFTT